MKVVQYLFYNETEIRKSLSGIVVHFLYAQNVCVLWNYILGCHSQQVLLEQSSNSVLIHEFESA